MFEDPPRLCRSSKTLHVSIKGLKCVQRSVISLSLQSYHVSGSKDPPDPPLSLSFQSYRVSESEILIWLCLVSGAWIFPNHVWPYYSPCWGIRWPCHLPSSPLPTNISYWRRALAPHQGVGSDVRGIKRNFRWRGFGSRLSLFINPSPNSIS